MIPKRPEVTPEVWRSGVFGLSEKNKTKTKKQIVRRQTCMWQLTRNSLRPWKRHAPLEMLVCGWGRQSGSADSAWYQTKINRLTSQHFHAFARAICGTTRRKKEIAIYSVTLLSRAREKFLDFRHRSFQSGARVLVRKEKFLSQWIDQSDREMR